MRPSPPPDDAGTGLPRFAEHAEPEEAFLDYLQSALETKGRIALAGRSDRRTRALRRIAEEHLGRSALPLSGWAELCAAPRGTFAVMDGLLELGFAQDDIAVLGPGDILPRRETLQSPAWGDALALPVGMQIGDAAIHLEHGLSALRGVNPVTADDVVLDAVAVQFAGDATELVPVDQMDRLWRYGADAQAVTLDRLGGDDWPWRRGQIEAEIAETATALLDRVAAWRRRVAPVVKASSSALENFAARFPHPLTDHQRHAIPAGRLAMGLPVVELRAKRAGAPSCVPLATDRRRRALGLHRRGSMAAVAVARERATRRGGVVRGVTNNHGSADWMTMRRRGAASLARTRLTAGW